jgi:hypothetical protein
VEYKGGDLVKLRIWVFQDFRSRETVNSWVNFVSIRDWSYGVDPLLARKVHHGLGELRRALEENAHG